MQRRNFFKNLVASVVGVFAVSKKPAKAQEKLPKNLSLDDLREELKKAHWIRKDLFYKIFDRLEGMDVPKAQERPKTTLRFNENRIEAWNGEKWFSVFGVYIQDDDSRNWRNTFESELSLSIPSPTAEQRAKLNNDVGEVGEPLPPILDLHRQFVKECEDNGV